MRDELVYFPEPPSPDRSFLGWDETAVEWLRRSTTPQAKAVREFLNRTLANFPPKHATSLAKRLNQDWQSHLFEIVVGRYLQVLGAYVEPEPLGSNGTRVDFRATFPGDQVISVECVSKRFNQQAQQTIMVVCLSALMLGIVVFLAMIGSCFISGICGAVVPLILKRFGADPATASSIFLTTATNVASMGLLLGLAAVLVK